MTVDVNAHFYHVLGISFYVYLIGVILSAGVILIYRKYLDVEEALICLMSWFLVIIVICASIGDFFNKHSYTIRNFKLIDLRKKD